MDVLTRMERLKFWFLTNRKPIGLIVLGLSGIFRVALTFQGHSETADTLKGIADLILMVGGGTAAAGATHGDEHYEAKRSALIRTRSGRFPAFQMGEELSDR